MEVKAGFKKTEVGIIPEDWNIESLINCCDYVDYRGKTPHKSSSGTFLITARNVRKGFIDYEISKEYVPTDEYDFTMSRGKPKLGDVIITTEAPLGNVAQIDREDVALAQRIIKYRPKNLTLYVNYLKHYLLSDRFQAILNSRSSGSTATGIKGSVLHQQPVVIPPVSEQEAIAAALGDADALIESLEQLLAKKRLVKQGAMQELLTPPSAAGQAGKRRLPGFGGAWEEKALKTITQTPVTDGPHLTPKFITDGIPFLSVNNLVDNKIDLSDLRRISYEDHLIFSRKCKPQRNDILFGKAASVGKVAIVEFDMEFDIWSPIALIRIGEKHDPKFVYYYFQTRDMLRQINILTNSSSQGNISMGEIEKLVFLLPPKPEQIAIAEALGAMDAEIAALEAKLSKARLVKQGMMQELLTGRIRLV